LSKDDLESKILAEIEKTGYPFELWASECFRSFGYHVANNIYFVDKDEGKGREYDVRALKNEEIDFDGKKHWVRHCLLVECKRSVKRPWVLFTSTTNSYDQSPSDLYVKGMVNEDRLQNIDSDDLIKGNPVFSPPRRGRSFFEPFKDGDGGEAVFKALTTATKALVDAVESSFAAGGNSICFYYPIVLFDGILFEAYLENKEIRLEHTDHLAVSMFYRSATYKEVRVTVPIVTKTGMADFIGRLDAVLGYWGKTLCHAGDFAKR
jgi:hypothetical protein